ncbi:MAG: LysR family transcriptional regulator [Sulfurifustis sp.]
MRRLPPFPELVAFEAVARHLSFTRAADELCITQSAVSHRVRRLEEYFGQRLIRRINPGIELTEAGTTLLPDVVAALDALSRLNKNPERRIRVAAGSALCTWWLTGRLPSFMARRPGLSVELAPIAAHATSVPEADVHILWVGEGENASSTTQAPLPNEFVFPVCSPRILPREMPLHDPKAIGRMTLLNKAIPTTGEWNWATWLDQLGVDAASRRGAELRIGDIGLMMSAALDGAGVTLAKSLVVYDALQAKRLTIPVVGLEPMICKKKYVVRWLRSKAGDSDIVAFVNWIVEEAEETIARTTMLVNDLLLDARQAHASVDAQSVDPL